MNAKWLRRGCIIIALLVLGSLPPATNLWRDTLTTHVALAQIGPSFPDIGGVWIQASDTYGTRGQATSITQHGQDLTITNEFGGTATGHFTSSTEFAEDGNGITASLSGLVGNCYTRINWSNGTSWTRTAPASGCGTTLSGSGGAQVWSVNDAGTQNPPQYQLFDDIQVCFSQPAFGATVLTDITADGNSTVLYQYGGDAGTVCLDPGTVLGPVGQECIRMDFTPVQGGVSGSPSSVQTCWQDVP